ncbi:MAG: hemerythrin domain-containing protein [Asticcacaulis sp.]
MDIYSYIRKDHRKVAGLMDEVVASKDPSERQSLFATIRQELILHLGSEEKTFYKAIENATRAKPVEEQMQHAEHEHDEVRDYLKKLEGLDVRDEAWIETFGEFKHAVAHHVEEEEGDVWEKAKTYLSHDDALALAKAMDAAKKQEMQKLAEPAGAGG